MVPSSTPHRLRKRRTGNEGKGDEWSLPFRVHLSIVHLAECCVTSPLETLSRLLPLPDEFNKYCKYRSTGPQPCGND